MSTWVLDLDGVVWRGDQLIPGSELAVTRLLDAGHAVVACTNHAMGPEVKRAQLERLGVAAIPVVTSAEAAAARCEPGARVLVLGDPTLVELLRRAELDVIDVWDCDEGRVPLGVEAVVVGATPRWDRSRVGMVADAVRDGAHFLATNDDATYPTSGPDGPRLLPGNGALVAAVAVTSGRAPEVTGKPHRATAALLEARHGPVDVVVGDKPETDGGLALELGASFALVLSGVTNAEHLPVEPEPTWVAADLASLVETVLSVG